MTNPRELREAALSMRVQHPLSHPRHEMWEQMARLMEKAALGVHPEALLEQVSLVGQAYNAAVDRPDISSDGV
jgi:hypothetical protein